MPSYASEVDRSSLSVRLLGPIELSVGDRVLSPRDFGGRKPKQVLEILLVSREQPVPKDRIADLLWGTRLPTDPMRTLEAYVSILRARLTPLTGDSRRLVRSEPGAYRSCLDDVEVDLDRFDALGVRAAQADAVTARIAALEEQLELVRGELLADEPYATWALPLRELYAERALQVRLDLAEECLRAGRLGAAVEHAERVLVAQPARERAYRLLVVAHHAAGNQELALAAYHRCRHVLTEEFGVHPLAETERTYLAVLAQSPVELPARIDKRPPSRPRTRFAHNGDATIAYQVIGDGPDGGTEHNADIVVAHAWFSHMEIGWEEPHYENFLHRLARGRRLIVFDRRGMGMSDPAPPTVSIEERAGDIRAVMDAAGSSHAALLGSCGSGPVAIALATLAPDRVSHLILFGTFARMLAAADYPAGWSRQFFDPVQGRPGARLGDRTGHPTVGALRRAGRGADGMARPAAAAVGHTGDRPGDPGLRRHHRRPAAAQPRRRSHPCAPPP